MGLWACQGESWPAEVSPYQVPTVSPAGPRRLGEDPVGFARTWQILTGHLAFSIQARSSLALGPAPFVSLPECPAGHRHSTGLRPSLCRIETRVLGEDARCAPHSSRAVAMAGEGAGRSLGRGIRRAAQARWDLAWPSGSAATLGMSLPSFTSQGTKAERGTWAKPLRDNPGQAGATSRADFSSRVEAPALGARGLLGSSPRPPSDLDPRPRRCAPLSGAVPRLPNPPRPALGGRRGGAGQPGGAEAAGAPPAGSPGGGRWGSARAGAGLPPRCPGRGAGRAGRANPVCKWQPMEGGVARGWD